jgi:hypothetical protein
MATRLLEAEGSVRGEGPNEEESETTMGLGSDRHQKTAQAELALRGRGEAPRAQRSGESRPAVRGDERSGNDGLMERVVERSNFEKALKRVKQNKGSPGVDGMSVDELVEHLTKHWKEIRAQLLEGTYGPSEVRGVEIPKNGGGAESVGFRQRSTGTSSRASCRCCSRWWIRPSRSTATVSDLDVERTMHCARRSGTSSGGATRPCC